MGGKELNQEDKTILQATVPEDSLGGRRDESEGQIQKTLKANWNSRKEGNGD